MAVPGERPEGAEGATTAPAGSALPFVAANSEIVAWLDILLKGRPEQQVLARTEIALILERLGFPDDAEEAYWTNVQSGATDRRAYDRLLALAQQRGDRLSESLVRRKLAEVFNPPGPDAAPADAAPEPEPAPGLTSEPADDWAPPVFPTLASGPPPASAPEPPGHRPGVSNGQASGPGARVPLSGGTPPATRAPSLGDRQPPSAAGPVAGRTLLASALAAASKTDTPAPATPAPTPPAAPRPVPPRPAPTPVAAQPPAPVAEPPPAPEPRRAMVLGRPASARPTPTVVTGPVETTDDPSSPYEPVEERRRRAALSPNPGPFAWGSRFSTQGLIALQPATIGAFLLASFGAAALIAFLLIAAERGTSARATPTPVSQQPARCVDGAIRFPGANDPRAAVVNAYRQNGVDVEAPRPGGPRVTADQAEQVVGSWIAFSLMLEQAGQPAPTLAGWVDPDTDRPTLANAILRGRRLDSMLTPEEWSTIRSWPATTCEGAFMHDPRNAGLVRLMERVVAR